MKDIICFANIAHNKDCYLIFGVSDDFEVIGMKEPRRKEADIIDHLSTLSFAGEVGPQVKVKTIVINDIEIDVLIIKSVNETPIYLNRNYGGMLKGCIYARHGDSNTPNKGNAAPVTIENLWKKDLDYLSRNMSFLSIDYSTKKNGSL